MRALHRWSRRVAFALLALTALYLVARVAMGVVSNRRLEAVFEAVRERGEPLTLAEAAPPPVPETANAAPLLLEAERVLEAAPVRIQKDVTWTHDANEATGPGQMMDRFDQAPLEADAEDVDVVRDWLAAAAPALPLLEEAARRPDCRFDVLWEEGPMPTGTRPFPLGWRRLNYLRRRAYVALHEGRPEEALGSITLATRLADLGGRTPLLIASLWHAGKIESVVGTLEDTLEKTEGWSPQHAALLETLASQPALPPLPRVFTTDRAWSQADFARALLFGSYDTLERSATTLDRALTLAFTRPWMRLDQAAWMDALSEGAGVADRPWHESREAWTDFVAGGEDSPWWSMASRNVRPLLRRVALKRTRAEARRGLAVLALRLERYRSREGRLPEKVEAVDDGLRDPFSGRPYGYEVEGVGAYRLWSVGEENTVEFRREEPK